MVKSSISPRDFCFRNVIMTIRLQLISMKHACSLALSRSSVHKKIYTERMIVLGKLVYSVSINPVLSTIKLLRWFAKKRSWRWRRHLATIWIVQASEKAFNRKYLLKVAQTVQYLARPGWPLKEDSNEIEQFCQLFFFVEIMIQR